MDLPQGEDNQKYQKLGTGVMHGWDNSSSKGAWSNISQPSSNAIIQSNKRTFGPDSEGINWTGWVQEQRRRGCPHHMNAEEQKNINFLNLLNNPVIYIQQSPAKKRIEELKRQGRTFIDDSFPAQISSLIGQYPQPPNWQKISWKKISDIVKNPVIFSANMGPNDIEQGLLSDCYFMAALSALAQRPQRIKELFLVSDFNEQKYFSMKLLYKGKWMTVDVDQFIPWVEEKQLPAFGRTREGSLWVVLLEKAWAKLYNSYKRIQDGFSQQPLHDLTGAPIFGYNLKNQALKTDPKQKTRLWSYLLEASDKQYAMVVCSDSNADKSIQSSPTNILFNHVYTLLNVVTLSFQNQSVKLIHLRNPWADDTEYRGKWSDFDPNWEKVTPEEKKRVKFQKNQGDGAFFIEFQDFVEAFNLITVAQVIDNASYVYRCVKDKQGKGVFFGIDIGKEDLYCFQVDKTPYRMYPKQFQHLFKYPQTVFQMGRVEGKQIKKLSTLYRKQKLVPGRYIAYVKIAYDTDFEDQFDVNLAAYSSTACNIQLATKQQAILFSGNKSIKWQGEPVQPQPALQPNPNPVPNQNNYGHNNPYDVNNGWPSDFNPQGNYNNNYNINSNWNQNKSPFQQPYLNQPNTNFNFNSNSNFYSNYKNNGWPTTTTATTSAWKSQAENKLHSQSGKEKNAWQNWGNQEQGTELTQKEQEKSRWEGQDKREQKYQNEKYAYQG